ncbi:MAG: MFS transporter, partial [Anaerolineaceae bacterium]|nr:MFS transporter [Anaerolineaceae bacterium]
PKASLLDFKTFKKILTSDKNFRSYLISRSFAFMGNMAMGFLAVYAVKRFDLADEQAAIFTGLLFLSGIIGYAVWGVLGDKIGPKRILIISWAIWMGALIVAIISPTPWIYYGVFLLLGLSSAGGILGDIILVMELGNENQRPAYLGLARTLPGIFLLIAPLLAGGVISLSNSYPLMFAISLVFSGLGIVFLLRVKDRERAKKYKLN